jgi:hypothetical protein
LSADDFNARVGNKKTAKIILENLMERDNLGGLVLDRDNIKKYL